jgi:hypothetical protein
LIVYRHADPRFPFLWEGLDQPPARWHVPGEGPVHYFADTPDGAWAEFLRHEGITNESELVNMRRALWAIELPEEFSPGIPRLPEPVLTGGIETYEACQKEARRLRAEGVEALRLPSAAVLRGGARGWRVEGGLQLAAERNGLVFVVFGARPDLSRLDSGLRRTTALGSAISDGRCLRNVPGARKRCHLTHLSQ